MAKQIFVHIGLPKTASTTIQSHLYENAHRLLTQGVLYPETGRRHLAHHDIGFQVVEDPRFSPVVGDLAALAEEISRTNVDKVVISTEALADADRPQIQSLKDLLSPLGDVNVLIYLRRQDLWLQSLWAQGVKTGYIVDPFETFLEKAIRQEVDPQDPLSAFVLDLTNADFYSRVMRWEQVFGKGKIIVKILEKQAIQKSVFEDFLDEIDVALPNPVTVEDKNISPGIKTLQVIRYLIRKIGRSRPSEFPSLSQLIANSIRDFATLHDWDTVKANCVSKETYQQISDAFADSNSNLARSYFGRDELFLDPYEERPVTTFDLDDLAPGELLELMAHILDDVRTKRYFMALARDQDHDISDLHRSRAQRKALARLKEENAKLIAELKAIRNDD